MRPRLVVTLAVVAIVAIAALSGPRGLALRGVRLLAGGPAVAETLSNSLIHDGLERTYELFIPRSYNPRRPAPLVLVFHGGFGSGARTAGKIGMNAVAERNGFLVAYPDGVNKHWNDGRPSTENGVDDVGFISALIDTIAATNAVDLRRVYATGLSNGGFFTQRLACQLSDKIAAFAPVMSSLPVELARSCRPSRVVPIMMISGENDPLVPWNGGTVTTSKRFGGFGGKVISVPDTVRFWRNTDGCRDPAEVFLLPDRDPNDGTRVREEKSARCAGGAEVVLLAVEGGGHTWPGTRARRLLSRIVGATSQDINASEMIWAFFQPFALPR